jgi:hypothetical protein
VEVERIIEYETVVTKEIIIQEFKEVSIEKETIFEIPVEL